jgi:hypothetical protein
MLDERVPEDLIIQVSCPEESEPVDELILSPSPLEEKPTSDDLILEAESVAKASEITFDGETEFEARIEEAMKEYNAAMDKAAGIE